MGLCRALHRGHSKYRRILWSNTNSTLQYQPRSLGTLLPTFPSTIRLLQPAPAESLDWNGEEKTNAVAMQIIKSSTRLWSGSGPCALSLPGERCNPLLLWPPACKTGLVNHSSASHPSPMRNLLRQNLLKVLVHLKSVHDSIWEK